MFGPFLFQFPQSTLLSLDLLCQVPEIQEKVPKTNVAPVLWSSHSNTHGVSSFPGASTGRSHCTRPDQSSTASQTKPALRIPKQQRQEEPQGVWNPHVHICNTERGSCILCYSVTRSPESFQVAICVLLGFPSAREVVRGNGLLAKRWRPPWVRPRPSPVRIQEFSQQWQILVLSSLATGKRDKKQIAVAL